MIRKIINTIKNNQITSLALSITFLTLLLNAVHASYPDEFDNIAGGWNIIHGILPWSGFFSHHGALGYVFAAIINLFSGQSFVRFRFLAAIFYFITILLSYLILKKQNKRISVNFFLGYSLIFALSATYFWGHMFLADSLSGYFIIPAYGLLFLKIFQGERTQKSDLILISIFSSIANLISPTYIYTTAVIIAGTIFFHFFPNLKRISIKEVANVGLIFLLPYAIFALYLVTTGSIQDFMFQTITYNQKYYIYNYSWAPGETSINPIRYAIIIFNNFAIHYRDILTQIKDFNFGFPFNVTVAISSLFLWIYLLTKKKYLLIGVSFFTLVFSTIRGNVMETKSTDYQLAVYFVLSFFNASFLLFSLWTEINLKLENSIKPLYWSIFIFLSSYWFFTILFLFSQFWAINYGHYMGTQPMIYNRPRIAPVINSVIATNEYCWIGPFEFEEMYYLDCKLPSKYWWILPQFARSDFLMKEVIKEYSAHKPNIIVYRRDYSAFGLGPEYSEFFNKFLDQYYVRLKDIPKYKDSTFTNIDKGDSHPDQDFNFIKGDKGLELANKLNSLGYIKNR